MLRIKLFNNLLLKSPKMSMLKSYMIHDRVGFNYITSITIIITVPLEIQLQTQL